MKGLPEQVAQHVVERPQHLDLIKGKSGTKYASVAMSLKVISRTQTLKYSTEEFDREFGKTGMTYLRKVCLGMGLKKIRLVRDNGSVYIWSNDEK